MCEVVPASGSTPLLVRGRRRFVRSAWSVMPDRPVSPPRGPRGLTCQLARLPTVRDLMASLHLRDSEWIDDPIDVAVHPTPLKSLTMTMINFSKDAVHTAQERDSARDISGLTDIVSLSVVSPRRVLT